jgi:hypothetical protein
MTLSPLLLRAPEILRAAGCEVVEYPGWRTRGRPWDFQPRALMLHHDGSPVGPAGDPDAYARFLFEVGRPSEGIPAPLCQFWVDYFGRWWVGAVGGANHAGTGGGWGVVPANLGGKFSAGVEMDNTTGEPTTTAQYEALHVGLPALFKAYGWRPEDALTSHKEYAEGRKFDPDDIDMPLIRAATRHGMEAKPPPDDPPEKPPEEEDDDMATRQIAVLDDPVGATYSINWTSVQHVPHSQWQAVAQRVGLLPAGGAVDTINNVQFEWTMKDVLVAGGTVGCPAKCGVCLLETRWKSWADASNDREAIARLEVAVDELDDEEGEG